MSIKFTHSILCDGDQDLQIRLGLKPLKKVNSEKKIIVGWNPLKKIENITKMKENLLTGDLKSGSGTLLKGKQRFTSISGKTKNPMKKS